MRREVPGDTPAHPLGRLTRLADIEAYLKLRRRREIVFGDELFHDPVWDILLELYVATLKDVPLSVFGCCVASAVPQTTALRWIDKLIERGLVIRDDDAQDRRRSFLTLTPLAIDMVERVWP